MASKTPDLEKMTLEEVIEFRVGQKAKIMELKQEYDESFEVYKRKVLQFHLGEAYQHIMNAAEANGRNLQEQVQEWAENGDAGQRKQANLIALHIDELEGSK